MIAARWPLTIYYDGSCALCRAEMHALAAADDGRRLRLVDVAGPAGVDPDCLAAGLREDVLMQTIHARDAGGTWYRGVDVFALAYAAAGLPAVARALTHRRWQPLWDRLYPWVARHRRGFVRLGLARPYATLIAWAAHWSARRAGACATGACASLASRGTEPRPATDAADAAR